MVDETVQTPVSNVQQKAAAVSAVASANAPVIYFEGAPFFGLVNGVGKIALVMVQHIAPQEGGGVVMEQCAVAHLVGNQQAFLSLRAAIDGLALMASPAPDGPKN